MPPIKPKPLFKRDTLVPQPPAGVKTPLPPGNAGSSNAKVNTTKPTTRAILPHADILLREATKYTGTGESGGWKFPHKAEPNQKLYRLDRQTGKICNYAVYDDEGWILKRVDLMGKSHGGIPTPHVVEYEPQYTPEGKKFMGQASKLPRKARPDEIPSQEWGRT